MRAWAGGVISGPTMCPPRAFSARFRKGHTSTSSRSRRPYSPFSTSQPATVTNTSASSPIRWLPSTRCATLPPVPLELWPSCESFGPRSEQSVDLNTPSPIRLKHLARPTLQAARLFRRAHSSHRRPSPARSLQAPPPSAAGWSRSPPVVGTDIGRYCPAASVAATRVGQGYGESRNRRL